MVKPRLPLHREIAEVLSERIISGEYPTKSLLPTERELCESMGVSRTVIREAVKSLESRGLVRIDHGRGTMVQEPQTSHLSESLKLLLRRRADVMQDLLEIRQVLEVGIAALAAERRTEANLEAMRRWLDVMRQKPDAPEGYVDADVEFHAEIARATQNPVVLVLLDPLTELLRESRKKSFSGPEVVKLRTRQHEEIFEHILAREADAAREAMRLHLAEVKEDLTQSQARGQTQRLPS
jgi:GntR family transcriptional repressor for pyruvate dehydrogenase complex